MTSTGTHHTVRTTHRTRRTSLSPYYTDDTAFTLADIRRNRALDTAPVEH
jgi:hypothetical protein